MSTHARLSPSSAEQWINCPGSVQLQECYPESDDGVEAKDGDLCHLTAARLLNGFEPPSEATPEILDAARYYESVVREVTGAMTPKMVETRVDLPQVHPDCWGTPDAAFMALDALHVWDLKYGWGIVEVYNNWQLMLYALGVLALIPGSRPQRVVLHIVQPRPYHPDGHHRQWEVPYTRLLEAQAIARISAEAALSPEPHCLTGKHCKHCSALLHCDAARAVSLAVIDVVTTARHHELTTEQMGFELTVLSRMADIINHRLDAALETALTMSKQGVSIPGWVESRTPGRTEFDPTRVAEVKQVAAAFGVAVEAAPKLLTPNQVVKAGLPADLVAQYTIKTGGNAKMVPVRKDKPSTQELLV